MKSTNENFRIIIIDDNLEIHRDFIKILSMSAPKESKILEYESKIFGESAKAPKINLPKFIIDTASQGQEGVKKIAKALEDNKPYALAFVDIRMPPGWDGIETIKRIWELDSDIQIVICTAYSDYSWEETVEQLGQKENLLILKKPFDHIAVRQLSVALTKKWQLMQDSRDYMELLEVHVQDRTRSLQESLSITRGTLESTVDGILVLNSENKLIDYNSKLVEMWNIPRELLDRKDGEAILKLISGQLFNQAEFDQTTLELRNQIDKVVTSKVKTTTYKVIEHYTQAYTLDNKVAGRIWSFRDITHRSILEDKIKYQAMHDDLTGLPNRNYLMEYIQQEIDASSEYNEFSILFFDLDRFKLINDSFSHKVGDDLLKTVSQRIITAMRDVDFIARLGGDEFVAVIPSAKSELDIAKIATKLIYVFNVPFRLNDRNIMVSPSIGISIYPLHGKTVEELLQHADMAMYRAKELGGNQFQMYTSELKQLNLERLQVEAELHQAVKNDEFFLYYQPQVDMKRGEIVSVEALIRWNHPEKGLILPIEFIPFAEEVGLMNAIGNWTLRKACSQNKEWQDKGLPSIRMAVNVTTQQFKQPDFVETVMKILKETRLEPHYLEIEITENIIINSVEAAKKIQSLRELGIFVALDDFGTGYASLNYLKTIPVDRLKIDKSFIQNIALNQDDEVIIQAIISMAKSLELEIIAEGVETKDQMDFLKALNCEDIQGYYFSKPLTPEELMVLLKKKETVGEI